LRLRRPVFCTLAGRELLFFNWLFTRHHSGEFVLRDRDTDQVRSTDESTKAILDAMNWLGLNWDEGPYFQAERVGLHREMVQKLINEGKAYYCTCTPEELETKRKQALTAGKKPKMTALAAIKSWIDRRAALYVFAARKRARQLSKI